MRKPFNLETGPTPTILAATTVNPASIAGLSACVEDARQAARSGDAGPAEPNSYRPLLGRLEAVRNMLPPLYRDSVVNPYIRTLQQLGEHDFKRILASDPPRERLAGLMMDIAQAILQQGEGFNATATDAFQEVGSDLYDGFLSAEDRKGVTPPDLGVIPPLVKWGNPDAGPYTWPVDATGTFGLQAAVVSLPPANASRGLLAWSALGHETAGHDILHADDGLQAELADALQKNLALLRFGLGEYWSSRIDETSSDVMGILNIGPAAGIGLVGYFRALNAAFGGRATLRSSGPASDPHPADVVRGYLAAEVIALLKFAGRRPWSNLVAAETDKDARTIVLGDQVVSRAVARQSAKIVAQTLVTRPARALEGHALGEIQNWRDADERKVKVLRTVLTSNMSVPDSPNSPIYAAHVVAAAVTEALAGSSISMLFRRMLDVLSLMHRENPSWGPLFVAHPGNLARDLAYCRSQTTDGDGPMEAPATRVELRSRKLERRRTVTLKK